MDSAADHLLRQAAVSIRIIPLVAGAVLGTRFCGDYPVRDDVLACDHRCDLPPQSRQSQSISRRILSGLSDLLLGWTGVWVTKIVLAVSFSFMAGRGGWAEIPVFGGLARSFLK